MESCLFPNVNQVSVASRIVLTDCGPNLFIPNLFITSQIRQVLMYVLLSPVNPVPRQRIFLLGGPDRLHGVLHIEYIGRNGTVCDDSFGREEAYVVCRQLGYQ